MPDITIFGRYSRTLTLAVLATTSSYAVAGDYNETLTLQGITFEVFAEQANGKSNLTIKPSGLQAVNDAVSHDMYSHSRMLSPSAAVSSPMR
jgi:hypothetical protein